MTEGALIGRHTVGDALVLHARERISHEAQALAVGAVTAGDDQLVIADLHAGLPIGAWEALARELPAKGGGIRLVACGVPPDMGVLIGQWLADRLKRPVVTPYGHALRNASGTLFVHGVDGAGWIRHRAGGTPHWEAKRHPRPVWDEAAADYVPTGGTAAAEPLPGGVWIRDSRDEATVSEHWQRLAATVPCQPEALTVLLGCPGTVPLPLDDVARFWRRLGDDLRSRTRFVGYGPVRLPTGTGLGQALADLLEGSVVCFAGLPAGRPDGPRMHTILPEGGPGWPLLVRELGYRPGARVDRPPKVVSHQAPAVLGAPDGWLTHRYAPDAVVEIVQSGLWLRPPGEPRNAARIRARPADPRHHALIIDDGDPARVRRLRELAEDLAARLDPATREASMLHLASTMRPLQPPAAASPGATYLVRRADLMPAPALVEARDAGNPPVSALGAGNPGVDVLTTGTGRRGRAGGSVDPEDRPAPAASSAAPVEPLWDPVVRPVSPAIAGGTGAAPAARTGTRAASTAGSGAPADAIEAVRRYLTAEGLDIDTALRSGATESELLTVRALRRAFRHLPAYRGPALVLPGPEPIDVGRIADRRTLTERAFLHALTEPPRILTGEVDVLIWSMTARRTHGVEPVGEHRVPSRVVFLPGTAFLVLHAVEPGGRGRGRLFLRERAPEEANRDHNPFDDLVRERLEEALERFSSAGPIVLTPPGKSRVSILPGLG